MRLLVAAASLCWLVLVTGAVPAAGVAKGARAHGSDGTVVLVGLPGLSAADLSPAGTPALWRLKSTGASGSLSVRAVRRTTCPADGWLTVNSGARAGVPEPAGCLFPVVVPTGGGGAVVEGFHLVVAGNARFGYGARFGTLAGGASCATAAGPGAVLALADRDGRVDGYLPDAAAVDASVLGRCPLTVVDLGALPEGEQRGDAVRRADLAVARLGAVLPDGATLVVAGLADSGALPRLRVIVVSGPRFGAGRLDSPSTRQPGLVQLTDITPTVLDVLRVDPRGPLVGSVVAAVPDRGQSARVLRGQAVAADVQRDALVPFFTGFAGALLVLIGLAWWARSRPRATVLVGALALGLAAVPAGTFLANVVPWWTVRYPVAALAVLVAGAAAGLGGAAGAGPWRRRPWGPTAVLALVTAVVLGADAVIGSRLHLNALYGHSPLIGGRFYGFGNSTFAVFAVATVVLAAAFTDYPVRQGMRRVGALTVAATGLVAVLVDGWPGWGADFGGVLALVPAFGLLSLWVGRVRITAGRIALVGAGAAVIVALVATLDWLRPRRSRSHLGAFVQQVLDGSAGDALYRKAAANAHTFTDNWPALLMPVVIGLVVVLLVRPHWLRARRLASAYARLPTLRPGLAAATLAAVLGMAVNDSGATVPAMALTLAVPLTLATVLRATGPPEAPDGHESGER